MRPATHQLTRRNTHTAIPVETIADNNQSITSMRIYYVYTQMFIYPEIPKITARIIIRYGHQQAYTEAVKIKTTYCKIPFRLVYNIRIIYFYGIIQVVGRSTRFVVSVISVKILCSYFITTTATVAVRPRFISTFPRRCFLFLYIHFAVTLL